MLYNYTPLLKTLHNKGLTKKQLREILQLSPATMARMSAGDPIATETLGRICDLLQCDLSKIFTIVPEKEPAKPWDSLSANTDRKNQQTFRIYLYFLLNPDNDEPAEYLYGYAMPFIFDETDMDIWYATYGTGNHQNFCTIDGTLYANDVRSFIDAAMNRHTIEKILKLCGVKEIRFIKPADVQKLNHARIANGSFVYRPPYFLLPQNSSLTCQDELTPLLSYEEEGATICESLHGIDKKKYYTSKNGIDTKKATLLWSYLSENLPFHKNLNEIARLGNFEVLMPLASQNKQLVKCEMWQENSNPLGSKISINKQLTGNYILRVKFLNGRNPVLDNSYIVNPQNEEENPLYISLNEDYTFAEIELWTTLTTRNSEQRLIYYSSTPYLRQIAFTMSMLQRNLSLSDRWTQAMKQRGKTVNTRTSFFSSYTAPPITANQEEPWITEERDVQKDFHNILGNGNRLHDHDAFFPKGTDNIVAFLDWLKQRLQSLPDVQRVLLFDPYINDTAITKFIRSIQNSGISYEIITDSCPAKNKRDEEIENIKKLSSAIGAIIPCNLTVRSLNHKLHDRVLILAGRDNVTIYVLSNSLDAMAKKHSSIVTAVKPSVAQEIFNYYVNLVNEAETEKEEDNKIKLLLDTKNPNLHDALPLSVKEKTAQNITVLNNNNSPTLYTVEDFIRDYEANATETALENLSHMRYEEKTACIDYVLSLNTDNEITRLQNIINQAKAFPTTTIKSNMISYILSQNTLVKHNFDIAGALIEYANSGINYYFEYRSVLPAKYVNAIDILWQLSSSSYIHFFENLVAEQFSEKNSHFNNVPQAPLSVLIYSMLTHILKESVSRKFKEEEFTPLGKSEIAYLRAIFTARTLHFDEEFMKKLIQKDYNELHNVIQSKCSTICRILQPEEACTALIFLIKKIQTEICRHTIISEHAQPLIDFIIKVFVKTLAHYKKTDARCLIQQLAPLNFRNPEDICQIVNLLRISKHLTTEQNYEVLIHFWKLIYTKENGQERDFYTEDSIQRSKLIANEISKTGLTFTKRLLNEITKISRDLCARLFDPLLRSKNYITWKKAVEQLACLFITERYIVDQNDTLTMSKGEAEYQKLTENYSDTLSEYSIPYQIWKQVNNTQPTTGSTTML